MGTNEYYVRLVASLESFRETDFLCDTVLVTDDKRELKAHSVVLAAASSVFQTAFASTADRGPGPLQVNLREYESDIVEIALQFIYTGKLLLIPAVFAQKSEWSRLVAVLERLGLDMRLVDRCEKSFKDCVNIKKEDISEENFQNEDDSCGDALDCDDVSPKPVELECKEPESSLKNTYIATRCRSTESPKKPKRRARQNVRTRRSIRQPLPKVSTKNESETEHLPNGDLLPESSLSTADVVASISDDAHSFCGSRRNSTDAAGKSLLSPSARLYVCESCGRSFTKKERLILHERTHTGERPYECQTCGRRFSLLGNLRRHLPLHSGQKPYMCELCGRTFIRRAYLEDHLAVHVTAHPYACSLCPKRFNSGGQLRLHFRYVHDRSSGAAAARKWHPCEICNKNFSSKGNLRTHLRVHTGERPFVCACGKAYAQRIQLVQHARLHSDERPYSCDTCGRTFRFRSSCLIHSRTHSGERPHVCEQCGKSYTNKAGLRTHRTRVHAAGKTDNVPATDPLLTVLIP